MRLPLSSLIFSDNRHWYDSGFKHYLAISQEKGSKIICCQHGGSLTQGTLSAMNFEEEISESFLTWTTPLHPKHVRLPPLKYANRGLQRKLSGSRLSVIGFDNSRYVKRCEVNAQSGQVLEHLLQVKKFHSILKSAPSEAFCIRPYPKSVMNWNLNEDLEEFFGKSHVRTVESFDNFLSQSRLVVCTYPETTFSDCIARDLPTIILYPNCFWELHSEMMHLLEILIKANLVFHDPSSAAQHVNKVWPEPMDWWQSQSVRDAITSYNSIALDLESDPIQIWKTYIKDYQY